MNNIVKRILSYNIFLVLQLLFNYMLIYLGVVSISVLSTMIIDDPNLDITKERLGNILFISSLGRMVGKMIGAMIVDNFNPKAIVIATGALKSLGIILFAFSNNYVFLLIWWVFQETIWAPIWQCNVKIMGNWFDNETIGEAMGVLSLSWLFGDAVGRGILGMLISRGHTWRFILVFSASLSLAYQLVLIFFLKNAPSDERCIFNFGFLKRSTLVFSHHHHSPLFERDMENLHLSKVDEKNIEMKALEGNNENEEDVKYNKIKDSESNININDINEENIDANNFNDNKNKNNNNNKNTNKNKNKDYKELNSEDLNAENDVNNNEINNNYSINKNCEEENREGNYEEEGMKEKSMVDLQSHLLSQKYQQINTNEQQQINTEKESDKENKEREDEKERGNVINEKSVEEEKDSENSKTIPTTTTTKENSQEISQEKIEVFSSEQEIKIVEDIKEDIREDIKEDIKEETREEKKKSGVGDLLKNPRFWILFFIFSVMSLLRYTLFFWAPTYLVSLGLSNGKAAVGSLIFPAAGGIGAIVIGKLSDRTKREVGKDFVLFSFMLVSTVCVFFFYLSQALKKESVVFTLFIYFFIGFSLLGAYTMPGGVFSIRFGKDTVGACSSILDVGASLTGALSGLMSHVAGNDNRWDHVYFICFVFSCFTLVGMLVYIYLDYKKEKQSATFVSSMPNQ